MFKLIGNLINILIDIRRNLFFPWSVLGYNLRNKPRFKYKLVFLKTFYYVLFYLKHILLTVLLWPFLIRRFKCSKNTQDFFVFLFRVSYAFWFIGIVSAYVLMLLVKWFEIFIFFPLMRIIYFVLFEVQYRKNKKLLFKESTKQELIDFKGDNMHKSEKSLLTYKESFQYGSTYKKFTLPIFCSSPAINLNYEIFKIDKINTYEKAKEKLIEILSDDFFDLLDKINPYLEEESKNDYSDSYFKDAISIIYTLVKRLDYNCIFLYFIPYFFGYILRERTNPFWLEDTVNQLMRNYLENNIYKINPIFKQEKTLHIYQKYVVEKNDQVKNDFIKKILYYELMFSSLKKKYYFHSSDRKIDFTHTFLPIFFFRFSYIEKDQKDWLETFPELTGSIISNYNVLYPWLVYCY